MEISKKGEQVSQSNARLGSYRVAIFSAGLQPTLPEETRGTWIYTSELVKKELQFPVAHNSL